MNLDRWMLKMERTHKSGRKKRVAYLTNMLLDWETKLPRFGGGEYYCLTLGRLLDCLGFEVTFYQAANKAFEGDYYGFKVIAIPHGQYVSEFHPGICNEFYKLSQNYDHVIHNIPTYASGLLRDDALVICHSVWFDHDNFNSPIEFRSPEWFEELYKAFSRPRRIVSVDTNVINVIRALWPELAVRMTYIPNYVDTDIFFPPRRRNNEKPTILFPRRSEYTRGSRLMEPILERVPHDCRFLWVGDGEPDETSRIKSLAERDKRLQFFAASFEEMPQFYKQADICVIPAVASEGTCLASLEALASGCAVVATNVGGLANIFQPGVNALIIDVDAEQLSTAINRLIENPQERERLQRAGPQTAKHFSLDVWNERWTQLMGEIGWLERAAHSEMIKTREVNRQRRFYESLSIKPDINSEDISYILNYEPILKLKRPVDLICFPVIDWEFRYQRPQQLMSQFAAQGHRVFYIRITRFNEPGADTRVTVSKIKDNVFDITLATYGQPNIYNDVLTGTHLDELIASLDELRLKYHILDAISYVMISSWTDVALTARERWGWQIIYDCMDEWQGFPNIGQSLIESEAQLVSACDLTLTTAQRLYDKWQGQARKVAMVRNAVDYEFYRERLNPNYLLSDVKRPVVGYYGAIADWFDLDLMFDIAFRRPDYTFVLIGGVFDVDVTALQSLPNIQLLGQQPYEQMPEYLYHFDACIIPFKINHITEATDPVKLYEYMSGGKPTVCVALPEIEGYRDLLYIADNTDDFIARLDEAIDEDDSGAVERRKEFASNETWASRYRQIMDALAAVSPSVSIITVTHNYLAYTKLCLESIINNTSYLNYEIIVVDNASTDGTLAYLESIAKRIPNIKVISNRADEGFVRALNQGTEQSSGDHIIWAKSDTVFPQGWLSRLLRHLQSEETGLSCPVTNYLGSETNIEADYRSLDEMMASVNDRQSDGEYQELRRFTLFCAGLRRDVFDKVGPLDAKIDERGFEDDYVKRVRDKGYKVICAMDVFVHYFGKTANSHHNELAEYETQIRNLQTQLADVKSERKTLETTVSELRQSTTRLVADLKNSEFERENLSRDVERQRETAKWLRREITDYEARLKQIQSSFGWRLLNLYGPIKYRYLLPVYRMLGLMPQKDKVSALSLAESEYASAQQEEKKKLRAYLNLESKAHDIICFPVIEWDFRFQRPQQLMSKFAAAGHRVFYIKPRFRPSGEPYLIEEKTPNLYEVSLRGPDLNVYRDQIDRQSFDIIFASLDALRRDLSVASAAVIVQLPFWWPLAKQARDACAWPIIYDCMDFHAGFSTNTQQMIAQEEELLGAANLVIVSSSALEREARKHNSNVTVVRNGCDFDHFNLPVKSARSSHAVIGYYGAIADWFDSDLVADLAEKRPDWDFVLVGSTFSADISRLSKLPNVSMPGEKPYSEIPDWLAQFDVTIIPFRQTPLTAATNPVKAYEILASGKPIVSVPLPEIAPLSPLIRLASTADDFEREILSALDEDDPAMDERRRDFARSNTWDVRFRQLAPAIKETFPKASIIIVTYNNLELNRLCLESVYKRTEWPRFEVIVVDNASSDATPQYLKEAEKQFPNLHVILNTENRGFAAANNQALKIATGDYLVLLNNDTVAPRGWLWSLIKHLHSDPGIGLIGPVTNEIGNEAKIPVGYTQLEDMPVWAAEYARQNDGEIFHIPVLAMFCVAMRREVFERVGPLDESFQIGMFEDDDYTRRMREDGYRVVCARDAFMHHAGRASFKLLTNEQYLSIFERNRRVYEEKWGLWEPHMDQKNSKRIPALCERLNEIIARSKIDPGRIVIFLPSVGWNTPLHQRPHHLAKGLARQGYLVFFDCSGSVIDDFADFVPVEQNLWLYKGPKGVLDSLENPVIWTLPYNAHLTDRWPAGFIVYDLIDDLSVFPYRQGMLSRNHKRMLERAYMVLYVARKLESEVSGRSDALYFPNGVEFKRFASPDMNGEQDFRFTRMLAEGRPVLGYYGAIASWLNLDMLMEVAQMRKDWSLVIIGQKLPDAPSLTELSEMENVLILGPQRYESLPAYLSRFSAAMIPFKINQITEATSPLKLFEYFAGGKPVISAPMPECAAFEDVLIARDAREFSQAMDVALHLSGDAAFRRRLQTLARENSWEIRISEFMKLFEEKEAGKSRATFSSSDEGGRGKVKGKRA